MPFGKYQDIELTEISKSYLRWIRGQPWLGDWLIREIDAVLNIEPGKGPKMNDQGSQQFSVRPSGNIGQEIVDTEGNVTAWATDPWVGQVICKLLNENTDLLRTRKKNAAKTDS